MENYAEFLKDGLKRDKRKCADKDEAKVKDGGSAAATAVKIEPKENKFAIIDTDIKSVKWQITYCPFVGGTSNPLSHFQYKSKVDTIPENPRDMFRTLIIKAKDTENEGAPDYIIKFYERNEDRLNKIGEINTMADFNRNKNSANCYDIIPPKRAEGYCKINRVETNAEGEIPKIKASGEYYFIVMKELPLTNVQDLYKSYFNTAVQSMKCPNAAKKLTKREYATCAEFLDENYNAEGRFTRDTVAYTVDYQTLLKENATNNNELLRSIRKKATREAIQKITPPFRSMLEKLHKIHTMESQEDRHPYIHFDLKHKNMLAATGINYPPIYLIDWGSAVVNSGSIENFPKSSTPQFGIPYKNGRPVPCSDNTNNAACDVFSLCATLYYLITQENVYPGLTENNASNSIDLLLPISDINSRLKECGAPAYIRKAICRGLVWNSEPKKQIKSAKELQTKLIPPSEKLYNVINSMPFIMAVVILLFIILVIVCLSVSDIAKHKLWHDRQIRNFYSSGEYSNSYTTTDLKTVKQLHILANTMGFSNNEYKHGDYTDIDFCYSVYNNATGTISTISPRSTNDLIIDFNTLNERPKIKSLKDLGKFFPNTSMLVLENLNLPDELDTLAEMESLKQLYIYNCNVSDLEALKNVEELYIWNCGEPAELSGLEHLQNVRHLTLNGFDIDLSGIEKLENLEYLDLSGCTFDAAPLSLVDSNQIETIILDSITESTLDSTLNAIGGYTGIKTFAGRMNDYSNTCDKLTDLFANNSGINHIYLQDSVFSDMSGFEKLDKSASLGGLKINRAKNTDGEYWIDFTPFDDYITKVSYSVNSSTFHDVYVQNWYGSDLSNWFNTIESPEDDYLSHIAHAGYDTVAVIGTKIFFCHSDTSDDYTGNINLVGNVENDKFGEFNEDIYTLFYNNDNYVNTPHCPSNESISSAAFLTQLFPNVRRLILSECTIPLDCPELKQLDKLEEIYIDSCGTVDMSAFVDMPKLKYIHLSAATDVVNCEVMSTSEFGKLFNLDIFNCDFSVTEIPLNSDIGEIKLRSYELTTEVIEHLSKITSLWGIRIRNCDITDENALLEMLLQDNIDEIILYNEDGLNPNFYTVLNSKGYNDCSASYSKDDSNILKYLYVNK